LGIVRFEKHKDSAKSIVRRNTIFQWNELLKPLEWGFAEGSDVFVGLGNAEDGNEGDEENFAQWQRAKNYATCPTSLG